MKIVALIPYWLDYQVNEFGKHKNLKKLAGKYLINYSIKLLNSVSQINETIVYCSNYEINEYINQNLDYTLIKRDKSLDSDSISIDDIIKSFLNITDAEIIVLLHPNSPFLSSNILEDCLEQVVSKNYDSSFTAYKFNKLAWYKQQPLNYALDSVTPKLTALDSVVIEHSSLYIFTKDSFKIYNKRIGNKPYIKYINHFEGLEVESEEDFEIAELIVNSGMYPKV